MFFGYGMSRCDASEEKTLEDCYNEAHKMDNTSLIGNYISNIDGYKENINELIGLHKEWVECVRLDE